MLHEQCMHDCTQHWGKTQSKTDWYNIHVYTHKNKSNKFHNRTMTKAQLQLLKKNPVQF